MATVSGGTVFGLNFDTLDAAALVDYDQSDLQSTSARFFDDPSNYTLFQGVGFSYVSGVPVGGTVTSVQYVVNGSTVLRITGLSVAVTDVMAFVDSGDTTGLLNLALAGNDTLNGTPLADVLYGFAGNDVLKGGLGLDTLDGGVGLDTADYSDKTTAVAVTL
ncbi:Ca2+-binding RTX toxin-like protein, partial [Mesorhizobium robiniae]